MKCTELAHTEECLVKRRQKTQEFVDSLSDEDKVAMLVAIEYFSLHVLLTSIYTYGQEKLPVHERLSLKELVKMEEDRDRLLERLKVLWERQKVAKLK